MQEHLIIGLVFLVFSLLSYQVTGTFINYFWQDAKEEATLVLEDERSSKEFPKKFNWQTSVFCLFSCALFYFLLIQTDSNNISIFIKINLFLYFLFISLIDFRAMILPDILNYIGVWSGVLIACLNLSVFGLTPLSSVLGVLFSYLVCWLIIHAGFRFLKIQLIGYGDAKYLAMFGAWFGFKSAYIIFCIGVFLACFAKIFLFMFVTEEKKYIPFGPFLALSATTMILYSNTINSYLGGFSLAIFS